MKLPSPGFLLNAFFQVCRRFPGVMLCVFAGVAALFYLIERDNSHEDAAIRLWMVCQLGLALITGIAAFSESKGWDEKRSLLLQGAGIAALAGYYFILDPESGAFENVGLPRYFVLLATAHLFVAVAPYLNRRTVRDFWEYNRQLFANIVVGAVFTLIMYAGLALAILAIDRLFDLNLQERIYMRLFVLLAGIFNTTYFLYHFPKNYEFPEADAGYNIVFKNLCKYILIPIVAIYFLILYAYGAKIVATWNLPRGWVSSLVLGFSVPGIFTYLLNYYLPEHDDSAWVRAYRKWFWWVLLPLTALLFVAIAKRIGDYGVTEPRFLVAHLGVWLAATCFYFLFSKHDNIKFIPISLGLFALVFAFGPFNAFKVAERSQTRVLQELLEKNGRWENGRMKQDTLKVSKEDLAQIISALDFLDRRDALSSMTWLPMPVDSFPKTPRAYNNATRIAEWAGIKSRGSSIESDYLTVNKTGVALDGLDVRGFSTFYQISLNDYREGWGEKGYFFSLSEDAERLEWHQVKAGKKMLIETFDLQTPVKKWVALTGTEILELPADEAVFDLPGKKATIRIFVNDAQIRKNNGDPKVQYLNGYLFLKEK